MPKAPPPRGLNAGNVARPAPQAATPVVAPDRITDIGLDAAHPPLSGVQNRLEREAFLQPYRGQNVHQIGAAMAPLYAPAAAGDPVAIRQLNWLNGYAAERTVEARNDPGGPLQRAWYGL